MKYMLKTVLFYGVKILNILYVFNINFDGKS